MFFFWLNNELNLDASINYRSNKKQIEGDEHYHQ